MSDDSDDNVNSPAWNHGYAQKDEIKNSHATSKLSFRNVDFEVFLTP